MSIIIENPKCVYIDYGDKIKRLDDIKYLEINGSSYTITMNNSILNKKLIVNNGNLNMLVYHSVVISGFPSNVTHREISNKFEEFGKINDIKFWSTHSEDQKLCVYEIIYEDRRDAKKVKNKLESGNISFGKYKLSFTEKSSCIEK